MTEPYEDVRDFEDVIAGHIAAGEAPWDPHTYAPWDGTGTPWPVDDGGFPMFPGGPGTLPDGPTITSITPNPYVDGEPTLYTAVGANLPNTITHAAVTAHGSFPITAGSLTPGGFTFTATLNIVPDLPKLTVIARAGSANVAYFYDLMAPEVVPEFATFQIVPPGPNIPHDIQILALATFVENIVTAPNLWSRPVGGADTMHDAMTSVDGITWQGAYPAEDWALGDYELWAAVDGVVSPVIAITIVDAPLLILTIPPEIEAVVNTPTVYATRLQNPGEALVGVIETFRFTARDGFPLDLAHITYEYQNDLGEWVPVPLTDDGAGLSGTTTFDVPADFDDAEDVRITFTRGGLYDGISTIESEGVAIAQETYTFNVNTPGFVIVTPADGAVVAPDALVSGSGANPMTAVQLLHKSKGYDRPVDVGNTDANGNWSFIQGYAPITVSPETIKVYQANTGYTPEITVTLAPAEDPPRPTLGSLVPATAAIEDEDFTVHLHGTGFTEDTVIVWGGGDEPTTFVSATEVTTLVKPSVVTAPTVLDVLVRNGDKTSAAVQFTWTSTPSEGWTVAELKAFAADHEPVIPIPSSANKPEILAIIIAYLNAHPEEN